MFLSPPQISFFYRQLIIAYSLYVASSEHHQVLEVRSVAAIVLSYILVFPVASETYEQPALSKKQLLASLLYAILAQSVVVKH